MKQEDYIKCIDLLEAEGIKIGVNGFYTVGATGRKRDAQDLAGALLRTAGVSVSDMLAEYKARVVVNGPTPPNVKNWFSLMSYIDPDIMSSSFNDVDRHLLSRIRYTYNNLDDSALLLVRVRGNRWAAVLMDGRASAVTEVARICSNAEPDDDRYKNLHVELTDKTRGVLNNTFKRYGQSKEQVDQQMLVSALQERLPATMLSTYFIKVIVSAEEIQHSEESSEVVYRPHGARFVKSPDSSEEKTIFHHLVEHADMLMAQPEMIVKMPRIFSNNPDEPALNFIELETLIDYDHGHPTWEQFFLRFSEDDAKVLRAFIWSIFDADNTGRQMLYIYDKDGFSGKSVMLSAIASILGENLVAALQKDSLNNQFSIAKIWNKRLITIGDNKNAYLVRSEKMHMILGGDIADVEKKGHDSFSVKLQTKVIASGNVQLNIDPDATHERTRVIVIVPKITDDVLSNIAAHDKDGNIIYDSAGRPQLIGDNSFEKKLIKEFRSMLADAKRDYEELCPTRSSIILPMSVSERLETLSSDSLDILDSVITDNFVLGDGETCKPIELHEAFNFAVPDSLKDDITYGDFLAHIAKKYGVVKKTKRPELTKHYFGISVKEA